MLRVFDDLPNYKKDDLSEKLIEKALGKSMHLQHIVANPGALKDIVRAMQSKKFPDKYIVIKAGEQGDTLFVCAKGRLTVSDPAGIFIREIGPGEAFGEMSFICLGTRKYTVIAETVCKLWILKLNHYKKILVKHFHFSDDDYVNYFRSIPLFKRFNYYTLLNLRNLARVECYPAKARIVEQGDYGNEFFIITGGSVLVSVRDADGRENEIHRLKRGDFFGEGSLLRGKVRSATVTAYESVECIVLDGAHFLEYLGNLESIRIADQNRRAEVDNVLENGTEYNYIEFKDLEVIGTMNTCDFGRIDLVQYSIGTGYLRTFALKCLVKADIADQGLQTCILKEKKILLHCRSPFIVRLYKTFKDSKYVYFLQEACLGGDLKQKLNVNGYFDDETVKFITACVVEALNYLHSRQILYNNLRKENLVLDGRGYVKLVGFSCAEHLRDTKEVDVITLKDFSYLGTLIYELTHGCCLTEWSMQTIQNEVIPSIVFKDHITKPAKSIVIKLWKQTLNRNDIRHDSWFHQFPWESLQNQTLRAPYIPKVQGISALSNFKAVKKDKQTPPDDLSNWDKDF